MKRLFVEEIIRYYDYTSFSEAEKHKDKMLQNGWKLKDDIIRIDQTEFVYTATYVKVKEA